MFEQALAFVLKRLLGEFVEDGEVWNDKIQWGVWSGLIVLENMVLKNSLLSLVYSPVALVHGSVGRLELRIPWARLGIDPVVILVDKINILVEPKYEWNPGATERREQAVKQAKLAAAELFAHNHHDTLKGASKQRSYSDYAKQWLMSAFVNKIIDNIQITVRDVHIRYEDQLSCPTNFCVGLTFESLNVLSRDKSFAASDGDAPEDLPPVMVDSKLFPQSRRAPTIDTKGLETFHKQMQLSKLSLYWNPLVPAGLNVCSCTFVGRPREEIQSFMMRTVPTSAQKSMMDRPRHHYLLFPVDISTYLDISFNPATGKSKAKVKLHIPNFAFQIEDRQVREIISVAMNMANFAKLERFSEYRPTQSVVDDPKAWWRYCIHAVLSQIRIDRKKRLSLQRLTERIEDKMVYIQLWKKKLITSGAILSQLNLIDYSNTGEADENSAAGFTSARNGREHGPSDKMLKPTLNRYSENYRRYLGRARRIQTYRNSKLNTRNSSNGSLQSALASDEQVATIHVHTSANVAVKFNYKTIGVVPSGGEGSSAKSSQSGLLSSANVAGLNSAIAVGGATGDTVVAPASVVKLSVEDSVLDPLNAVSMRLLRTLEYHLSFEDIILFRSLAEQDFTEEELAAYRKSKNGWLGSVFGWFGAASSETTRSEGADAQQGKERSQTDGLKLFEALKFDPDRILAGGVKPVDQEEVIAIISVHIERGSVSFALTSPDVSSTFQTAIPFLQLQLEDLRLRPIIMGDGAHMQITVWLQDFSASEILPAVSGPHLSKAASDSSCNNKFLYRRELAHAADTSANTSENGDSVLSSNGGLSPALNRSGLSYMSSTAFFDMSTSNLLANSALKQQRRGKKSLPPLIYTNIEVFPPGTGTDVVVQLIVEELEVRISPSVKWTDAMATFVTWPEDLQYWSEMEMGALNELADFKSQVDAKIEYMMQNHSNIVIEAQINAPVVIIADDRSLTDSAAGDVLVIDLGFIVLHTRKLAKAQRQRALEEMRSKGQGGFSSDATNATPNRSNATSFNFTQQSSTISSTAVAEIDVEEAALMESKAAELQSEHWEVVSNSNSVANYGSYRANGRSRGTSSSSRRSRADDSVDDGSESASVSAAGYDEKSSAYSEPLNPLRRGNMIGMSKDEGSINTVGGRFESNQIEEALFDIFQCQISDSEVYLIRSGAYDINKTNTSHLQVSERGADATYDSQKTLILEKFEIAVQIHVSVLPWDTTIPPIKLFTTLDEISTHLSERKLRRLSQFATELVNHSNTLISANSAQLDRFSQIIKKRIEAVSQSTVNNSRNNNNNNNINNSICSVQSADSDQSGTPDTAGCKTGTATDLVRLSSLHTIVKRQRGPSDISACSDATGDQVENGFFDAPNFDFSPHAVAHGGHQTFESPESKPRGGSPSMVDPYMSGASYKSGVSESSAVSVLSAESGLSFASAHSGNDHSNGNSRKKNDTTAQMRDLERSAGKVESEFGSVLGDSRVSTNRRQSVESEGAGNARGAFHDVSSDDEDSSNGDGEDDDDDSFFSVEEEVSDEVMREQKEQLHYIIKQRESMQTKLLSDIRTTESDPTKSKLHETLKRELVDCEMELQQLRVNYVELTMKADSQFVYDASGPRGTSDAQISRLIFPAEQLSTSAIANAATAAASSASGATANQIDSLGRHRRGSGHKLNLTQASTFRIPGNQLKFRPLQSLKTSGNKELVFVKLDVHTVNVTLECDASDELWCGMRGLPSKASKPDKLRSRKGASHSKGVASNSRTTATAGAVIDNGAEEKIHKLVCALKLSGIMVKLRHRLHDTRAGVSLQSLDIEDLVERRSLDSTSAAATASSVRAGVLSLSAAGFPSADRINGIGSTAYRNQGSNQKPSLFLVSSDGSLFGFSASSSASSTYSSSTGTELLRIKYEAVYGQDTAVGNGRSDFVPQTMHNVKVAFGFLGVNIEQHRLLILTRTISNIARIGSAVLSPSDATSKRNNVSATSKASNAATIDLTATALPNISFAVKIDRISARWFKQARASKVGSKPDTSSSSNGSSGMLLENQTLIAFTLWSLTLSGGSQQTSRCLSLSLRLADLALHGYESAFATSRTTAGDEAHRQPVSTATSSTRFLIVGRELVKMQPFLTAACTFGLLDSRDELPSVTADVASVPLLINVNLSFLAELICEASSLIKALPTNSAVVADPSSTVPTDISTITSSPLDDALAPLLSQCGGMITFSLGGVSCAVAASEKDLSVRSSTLALSHETVVGFNKFHGVVAWGKAASQQTALEADIALCSLFTRIGGFQLLDSTDIYFSSCIQPTGIVSSTQGFSVGFVKKDVFGGSIYAPRSLDCVSSSSSCEMQASFSITPVTVHCNEMLLKAVTERTVVLLPAVERLSAALSLLQEPKSIFDDWISFTHIPTVAEFTTNENVTADKVVRQAMRLGLKASLLMHELAISFEAPSLQLPQSGARQAAHRDIGRRKLQLVMRGLAASILINGNSSAEVEADMGGDVSDHSGQNSMLIELTDAMLHGQRQNINAATSVDVVEVRISVASLDFDYTRAAAVKAYKRLLTSGLSIPRRQRALNSREVSGALSAVNSGVDSLRTDYISDSGCTLSDESNCSADVWPELEASENFIESFCFLRERGVVDAGLRVRNLHATLIPDAAVELLQLFAQYNAAVLSHSNTPRAESPHSPISEAKNSQSAAKEGRRSGRNSAGASAEPNAAAHPSSVPMTLNASGSSNRNAYSGSSQILSTPSLLCAWTAFSSLAAVRLRALRLRFSLRDCYIHIPTGRREELGPVLTLAVPIVGTVVLNSLHTDAFLKQFIATVSASSDVQTALESAQCDVLQVEVQLDGIKADLQKQLPKEISETIPLRSVQQSIVAGRRLERLDESGTKVASTDVHVPKVVLFPLNSTINYTLKLRTVHPTAHHGSSSNHNSSRATAPVFTNNVDGLLLTAVDGVGLELVQAVAIQIENVEAQLFLDFSPLVRMYELTVKPVVAIVETIVASIPSADNVVASSLNGINRSSKRYATETPRGTRFTDAGVIEHKSKLYLNPGGLPADVKPVVVQNLIDLLTLGFFSELHVKLQLNSLKLYLINDVFSQASTVARVNISNAAITALVPRQQLDMYLITVSDVIDAEGVEDSEGQSIDSAAPVDSSFAAPKEQSWNNGGSLSPQPEASGGGNYLDRARQFAARQSARLMNPPGLLSAVPNSLFNQFRGSGRNEMKESDVGDEQGDDCDPTLDQKQQLSASKAAAQAALARAVRERSAGTFNVKSPTRNKEDGADFLKPLHPTTREAAGSTASTATSIDGNVVVSVDYFNQKLIATEPLVEPFSVKVKCVIPSAYSSVTSTSSNVAAAGKTSLQPWRPLLLLLNTANDRFAVLQADRLLADCVYQCLLHRGISGLQLLSPASKGSIEPNRSTQPYSDANGKSTEIGVRKPLQFEERMQLEARKLSENLRKASDSAAKLLHFPPLSSASSTTTTTAGDGPNTDDSDDSNQQQIAQIDVQFVDTIGINLTMSLLEIVFTTIQAVDVVFARAMYSAVKGSSSASMAAADFSEVEGGGISLIRIRNDSGMSLAFWTRDRADVVEVPPSAEMPLSIEQQQQQQSGAPDLFPSFDGRYSVSRHVNFMINDDHERTSYSTFFDIPLEGIGTRLFTLHVAAPTSTARSFEFNNSAVESDAAVVEAVNVDPVAAAANGAITSTAAASCLSRVSSKGSLEVSCSSVDSGTITAATAGTFSSNRVTSGKAIDEIADKVKVPPASTPAAVTSLSNIKRQTFISSDTDPNRRKQAVPTIAMELTAQSGAKTLVVRSTLRFFNATKLSMRIQLVRGYRSAKRTSIWEVFIPPRTGAPLPACLCDVPNARFIIKAVITDAPQYVDGSCWPHPAIAAKIPATSSTTGSDNDTIDAIQLCEFPMPLLPGVDTRKSPQFQRFESRAATQHTQALLTNPSGSSPGVNFAQQNEIQWRKKLHQQRGAADTLSYQHWLHLLGETPPVATNDTARNRLSAAAQSLHCNVAVVSRGMSQRSGGNRADEGCMLRTLSLASPVTVVNLTAGSVTVAITPNLRHLFTPASSTAAATTTATVATARNKACSNLNELVASDRSILNDIPRTSLLPGESWEYFAAHASHEISLSLKFTRDDFFGDQDGSGDSSNSAGAAGDVVADKDEFIAMSNTYCKAEDVWSEPVLITGCQSKTESMKTYTALIPFKNGASLPVQVEVVDRDGSRIISLFVPYWIVSSSFLPLEFQHNQKLLRNAAEQTANGRDGLLADQLYHSHHPASTTATTAAAAALSAATASLSSAASATKYALGHRSAAFAAAMKHNGLGRARGIDGVVLGPEVALRGTMDALKPSTGISRGVLSQINNFEDIHGISRRSRTPRTPAGTATVIANSALVGDTKAGAVILQRKGKTSSGGDSLVQSHFRSYEHSALHKAIAAQTTVELEVDEGESNYRLIQCGFSRREQPHSTQLKLRVTRNSAWSSAFSLDKSGKNQVSVLSRGADNEFSGELSLNSHQHHVLSQMTASLRKGDKLFTFGIMVTPAEPPFQRTQVVLVVDRIVLINSVGPAIEVRQVGYDDIFNLKSEGDEIPLWWRQGPQQLQVRLARYGWSWSGKFTIDKDGEVSIRLRNDFDNTVFFVLVQVISKGARAFIVFKGGDKFSPYRFENHTVDTFKIKQSGQPLCTNLLPYHCCGYAWDEPLEAHKVSIEVLKNPLQSQDDWGQVGTFTFDRLGPIARSAVGGAHHEHLMLQVVAQGPTRVLQLLDRRLIQRSDSRSESPVAVGNTANTAVTYSSMERAASVEVAMLRFTLKLKSLGVSIVDHNPQELLFVSLSGVEVMVDQFKERMVADVHLQQLQVDNQLWSTPYPTLLLPSSKTKSSPANSATAAVVAATTSALRVIDGSMADVEPFVSLSLVQDFRYAGVDYFPLLRLHVAPFDINVDGSIIARCIAATSVAMNLFESSLHQLMRPHFNKNRSMPINGENRTPLNQTGSIHAMDEEIGEAMGEALQESLEGAAALGDLGYTYSDSADAISFSPFNVFSTNFRTTEKKLRPAQVDHVQGLVLALSSFDHQRAKKTHAKERRNGSKQPQRSHEQEHEHAEPSAHHRESHMSTMYLPHDSHHDAHLALKPVPRASTRHSSLAATVETTSDTSTSVSRRPMSVAQGSKGKLQAYLQLNNPDGTVKKETSAASQRGHSNANAMSAGGAFDFGDQRSTLTAHVLQRALATTRSPDGTSKPTSKLYIEDFSVSAIRLTASFNPVVATESFAKPKSYISEEDASLLNSAVQTVLLAIGSTLAKIDHCPIYFQPYKLDHVFLSGQAFGEKVVGNYTLQALKQLYLVVLSSEVLGNPVRLLQSVGDGVGELVHSSASGLFISPKAFVWRVASGSASLCLTLLAGLCATAGSLASSLQVGMINLGVIDSHMPELLLLPPPQSSLDAAEHVLQDVAAVVSSSSNNASAASRNELSLVNEQRLQAAMQARGFTRPRPESLWQGLRMGISGVVFDPVKGFQSDGIRGLLVGTAKGTVGLAARPAFSLLGVAAGLFNSIAVQLDSRFLKMDKMRQQRMRAPRFFSGPDVPLQVYSADDNVGQELLSRLQQGEFRHEGYMWHTSLIRGSSIMIVTKMRMLIVEESFQRIQLLWNCPFSNVMSLEIDYLHLPVRQAAKQQRSNSGSKRNNNDSKGRSSIAAEQRAVRYSAVSSAPFHFSLTKSSLHGTPTLHLYHIPVQSQLFKFGADGTAEKQQRNQPMLTQAANSSSPSSSGLQNNRKDLMRTAGVRLAHKVIAFDSHEQLLRVLSCVLRRQPSLASDDVLQYVREAGIDVQAAIRQMGMSLTEDA